jgi:hypothetical protein
LPGSSRVTLVGQHEIKGLIISIDGTAKVAPLAPNHDVDLVHPPGFGRRALPGLGCGHDQRRILNYPPVQHGMVDRHAALGEDFFKVALRDGIAEVEKHGMQDNCRRVVYTLKINHRSDPPACFACEPSIAPVLIKMKSEKDCDTTHDQINNFFRPRRYCTAAFDIQANFTGQMTA